MAKQYGSQRRRGGASPLLVTLGILVVGLVGGALLLHATGAVTLKFLAKDEAPPPVDRTGQIQVPLAGRSIEPYAEVTLDHFINPATRQAASMWMPKEQADAVGDALILDRSKILGRVLRNTKPRGKPFFTSDFFPEGTRPGPTAGVPPGKRALRLKASDVPGLHGLELGDHFDIVMTVNVEVEQEPFRSGSRKNGTLDVEGPYADLHESQQANDADSGRVRIKRQHAEVRTIVNNGVLVMPVDKRTETTKQSSLVRGNRIVEVPVEEVIIAIAPEEVADLNFAMAVSAKLQVAMRSGQVIGEGVDEGRIPDLAVVMDQEESECDESGTCTTRVVEVIKGGQKRLMAVPEERVPTSNTQE